MMVTEVAHDGINSITHIIVAYTKIAMIRCCTTVSPSMPKHSVGRNQIVRKTASTAPKPMAFFTHLVGSKRLSCFAVYILCTKSKPVKFFNMSQSFSQNGRKGTAFF